MNTVTETIRKRISVHRHIFLISMLPTTWISFISINACSPATIQCFRNSDSACKKFIHSNCKHTHSIIDIQKSEDSTMKKSSQSSDILLSSEIVINLFRQFQNISMKDLKERFIEKKMEGVDLTSIQVLPQRDRVNEIRKRKKNFFRRFYESLNVLRGLNCVILENDRSLSWMGCKGIMKQPDIVPYSTEASTEAIPVYEKEKRDTGIPEKTTISSYHREEILTSDMTKMTMTELEAYLCSLRRQLSLKREALQKVRSNTALVIRFSEIREKETRKLAVSSKISYRIPSPFITFTAPKLESRFSKDFKRCEVAAAHGAYVAIDLDLMSRYVAFFDKRKRAAQRKEEKMKKTFTNLQKCRNNAAPLLPDSNEDGAIEERHGSGLYLSKIVSPIQVESNPTSKKDLSSTFLEGRENERLILSGLDKTNHDKLRGGVDILTVSQTSEDNNVAGNNSELQTQILLKNGGGWGITGNSEKEISSLSEDQEGL